MVLRYSLITATCLLLSACQSTPESADTTAQPGERAYAEMIRDTRPPAGPDHQVAEGVLSPLEAINGAAQAAPDGYSGTFGMQVRNIGGDRMGNLFLNSEPNYREQNNVTVRMTRTVGREIAELHGDDWINNIVGKHIEVDGEAIREVIWFNDSYQGRTETYYYQTQIRVTEPEQLRLLSE